jgi:protein involved in polysaccharide export with SLBB domain
MTQHVRRPRYRVAAQIAGAAVLALAAQWCMAQQVPGSEFIRIDPLSTSPRGRTQPPTTIEEQQQVPPGTPVYPSQQSTTDAATLLRDEDAAAADGEAMFGEQLFRPGAPQAYGAGFNPDYKLAIGDRVALRMWGAFTYEAIQPVDAQGNVFLPNVGPIRVADVRNADLNRIVQSAVRKVYRSNVGVYATLEASQPVRVYVTGYVPAPGQYAGLAAESILGYLSRAGGVDPERGSYIDVQVIRGGQDRGVFSLYDFLLDGALPPIQLQDGDSIVVGGRHNTVRVTGEVFNAYGFEFQEDSIPAIELLKLARPKPTATHVSIVHRAGLTQVGEYHSIGALDGVMLSAGDEVSVVADRTVASILVRVDGAIDSSRVLTLPYGSRLRDALALVKPKPEAQPEAVQLFRRSVAERQKEMLEVSLRVLESAALTARSATSEESALRAQEAALVERFVAKARAIETRGQVVLSDRSAAMDTLLEDGDVLFVPEQSSIVMVHGEVTIPRAIAYDSDSTVSDYVRLAGGAMQRDAYSRVLLMRQDGTFADSPRAKPRPGDEILVLAKVGTRNIEVTRGITQILYQLAVAARVALDL